jgi:hypothetical protein
VVRHSKISPSMTLWVRVGHSAMLAQCPLSRKQTWLEDL